MGLAAHSAFQFYANVFDGVVARHRFVRSEGLLAWGRATPSAGHVYAPNLRVQFVENTVAEGNHLWNWNGSYPYPHPKTVEARRRTCPRRPLPWPSRND